MKRLKDAWPRVTAYESLFGAFHRAAAGKWHRPAVAYFHLRLEDELLNLQRELRSGTYQPGAYRQFIIRDRKPRLISAAPFRDRVVHHAVMAEVEPWLDARFIYHTYACRQGKGAHLAVNYYERSARRYPYVLKLDLSRYFPSIRQDRLLEQLARYIADEPVMALLKNIVLTGASTIPGVGIPIGNLTSQVFANLYLNDIDHWLESDARNGTYLRYVDDLFILGDNKNQLWSLLSELKARLQYLGLSVHPRKQVLLRTREKVDILGYQISPSGRWLRNDNGYRAQRRLKRLATAYQHGDVTLPEVRQRLASWLGHAQHARCGALLKKILEQARFQRAAPG